jgi:hypothetical protein
VIFDLDTELKKLPLELDASTARVRELCEMAAEAERVDVTNRMLKGVAADVAAARLNALRSAAAAMRKVLTPESVDSLIAALLEGQAKNATG